MRKKVECPDSPTGKHEFSPDYEYEYEYDVCHPPVNCEHCGAPKPRRKRKPRKKPK